MARGLLVLALGAGLGWLIIAKSLAAALATSQPQWALTLDSSQPQALITLADRLVNAPLQAAAARDQTASPMGEVIPTGGPIGAFASIARKAAEETGRPPVPASVPASQFPVPETPGEQSQLASDSGQAATGPPDPERLHELMVAEDYAERALVSEPLSARAVRIRGQIAAERGQTEAALGLMQAAGRRSLHESAAHFWLMQHALEAKDFAGAVTEADILMRTRSDLTQYVVPQMALLAEMPGGMAALKTLFATNPPYRTMFLGYLPFSIHDARTPLELLLALKDAGKPPTVIELRGYLDFLVAHKYHELAYDTWLQFLPAAELDSLGLLFNGNFDRPATGLPFDWQIAAGSGATVEIAQHPDRAGAHALLVVFTEGRVEFPTVGELVVLAPGSYNLTGAVKGELIGRRGLSWRILCAEAFDPLLADGPMFAGVKREWAKFDIAFTVPAMGCRAQKIALTLDARSESEKLVSGAVWYEGLEIAPAPQAAAPLQAAVPDPAVPLPAAPVAAPPPDAAPLAAVATPHPKPAQTKAAKAKPVPAVAKDAPAQPASSPSK